MKKNSAQYTEGKESKVIMNRTLPMIIGMLGMLSFNLIDTYFIGQLGTDELAAISLTFPITYIVTALALGIGNGASAVVSRAIGSNDEYWVKRYSSDSLMLALIIVGIFLTAGLLTIDPLFTAIGGNVKTMPHIRDYMTIWYSGIIFVVIPMVGNSLIRATGDTKTPSFVMLVAIFINLALDPLLIFGYGPFPRMGMSGAAVATVISRGITLLVSLWILYYRDKMLSFHKPPLADAVKSWKDILYIGLPSAGTSLIVPISISVINSILAGYGNEAIAGFGVSARVEALGLSIIMALGSVLGPFVGQNIGAGKYDRVRNGVNYSFKFGFIWSAIVAGALAIFGGSIGGIFDDNPEVIAVVKDYMWIVPVTYGFQSAIMLAVVCMNVLKMPFKGAVIAILRMFILYIPLAFLGSELFGLNGIFVAATIANVLAGIFAMIWLKKNITREEEKDLNAAKS
jgi:putative MATE family efflux protein